MSRWRAALVHLALGAVVLAAILAAVRYYWYPQFLFHVQAAARTLPVLAAVCLVVGPLLTWVVFKPGKRGLVFDLVVIAVLQIAALTFSVHRLYSGRAYYLVYAVDRFDVVPARDVDTGAAVDRRLLDRSWAAPVVAVARLPEDPEQASRLAFEVMFEGKPDIERRMEYWTSYGDAWQEVVRSARSVSLLKELRPGAAGDIDRMVAASGHQVTDLLFVPVMGKKENYVVFIRKADGVLLDAMGLEPPL